jgi:hypothetical protein
VTTELLQSVAFGAKGNDSNYLGAGWGGPESGYRWMVGSESDLWLENPGPGNSFVLEVTLAPFCYPPALVAQRLAVEVRGRVVGRSILTSYRTIFYRIPAELVAERGPVRIIFRHPDAKRPVDCGAGLDERPLALSVRLVHLFRADGDVTQFPLAGGQGISIGELEARTGMPAKEFMLHFESLGDNCEFGLVQRRCGAEPLGLLRFTNMPVGQLVRGVHNDFDGLGELQNLEVSLAGGPKPEYAVRDRTFALTFHTFIYAGEADEEALPRQQSNRLKFLRRKMLEDFANGEKIFVCKRNKPLSEAEIMPLHAALNQHSRNTLLWVVPADIAHEAGAVEQIMPGLLKGYVDHFAPYENAHDLSFEVWLSVCANAWQLAQSAGNARERAAGADTDRLAQSDTRATAASDMRDLAPADAYISPRELVMQFESLGGAGYGCEFGMFQRSLDGVPVGLLGWTDLDHITLTDVLNARLAGLGDPANTEVVVPYPDGDAEYWARDLRNGLAVRCFMRAEVNKRDDQMAQVCRRLRYLRQKLIEDLAAGNKLFVFKSLSYNLTAQELDRLRRAVGSYGATTTLLYVCAADAEHPSGTARLIVPGLIGGHIAHTAACDASEALPATEHWLALCRSALAVWRGGAVASTDGVGDAATSAMLEPTSSFENFGPTAAQDADGDDVPFRATEPATTPESRADPIKQRQFPVSGMTR